MTSSGRRLDPAAIREEPGRAWCRAWTTAVDRALHSWLDEHPVARPVSLVALGSYARRELCGASDIDLLILHDGWPGPALEDLVRSVCYPLWDAGLSVGHAVRTVKEAVAAAGERVDSATALTDRRLVAGDEGLAGALGARTDRWLRRHGGQVLGELARADAERHAAAGRTPGLLEPDLKDGAGGLRDLQSLRWAAACVLGEVGLDPLVGARYVSAVDRRDLADAADTLLRARCGLHLVQGRMARDVLRLDLQDEVARAVGLADGDELLRGVGLASRQIAHVHGRTWAPLLADATQGRRRRHEQATDLGGGIRLVDGLVEVEEERHLEEEPSLGLRTIAAAAGCGRHLGRRTTERFARALPALAPLPWDEACREAVVATLRRGEQALPALADADHIGLLKAHLPEWQQVRGRPQRNPYHRYDLDTHGVQAVCELVAIADGGDGPELAGLWEGLPDPDGLLLGTFLHDVGKAWPGDHSVVGAEVARRWMWHMGFGAGRAGHVGALVRHHLLLPDVATRRDLDDPEEIGAVARAVGDVALLDGLYLLTLADSRATGPSAHSPWKDGLVAELHARVRAALADDPVALSAAFDPAVAAAEARRHADTPGTATDRSTLERLLEGLGDRYLLAASPEQCAAHATLLEPVPEPGELRASWRPGPAASTETLSVVAADRTGLIADCAGVLAAHGIRVLEARAFTRPRTAGEGDGNGAGDGSGDGPAIAVDWFVVQPPSEVDRAAVARDLAAASAGRLDVEAMLARRESRRDVRPPPLAAPPPVRVRFDVRADLTRVEVSGPDTPGLLSRLAAALAHAGLDIAGARVATLGPEVRDVFFVVTPDELPPEDELRAALRSAAAGGVVGS